MALINGGPCSRHRKAPPLLQSWKLSNGAQGRTLRTRRVLCPHRVCHCRAYTRYAWPALRRTWAGFASAQRQVARVSGGVNPRCLGSGKHPYGVIAASWMPQRKGEECEGRTGHVTRKPARSQQWSTVTPAQLHAVFCLNLPISRCLCSQSDFRFDSLSI